MKKCTWCGKHYQDEATICSIDAEPLVHFEPPPAPPAKPAVPPEIASPTNPNSSSGPAAASVPTRLQGCPRCGGDVQTLNNPWIVTLAIAAQYIIARNYGILTAVFVVGTFVAVAVLVSPVTCRKCGKIPIRDLPSKSRKKMILKKSFVFILLAIMLFAAQACLTAMKKL